MDEVLALLFSSTLMSQWITGKGHIFKKILHSSVLIHFPQMYYSHASHEPAVCAGSCEAWLDMVTVCSFMEAMSQSQTKCNRNKEKGERMLQN